MFDILNIKHYETILNLTNIIQIEKNIKDAQKPTRRETAMGGLLVLLMKSLLRTTLLKGALERRAKNLYNWTHQVIIELAIDCSKYQTFTSATLIR